MAIMKSDDGIRMSDGGITFIVDGLEVPYLKAYKNDEGGYQLVLDDRLAIVVNNEPVLDIAYFVAQAIAMGRGMSSFGHHAQPLDAVKSLAPAGEPIRQ